MLEAFPLLENYVDSSYTEAVRLLHIIGFEIGMPEYVNGALARKFTKRKI
jgi:hypothetical protein